MIFVSPFQLIFHGIFHGSMIYSLHFAYSFSFQAKQELDYTETPANTSFISALVLNFI